MFTYAQIDKTGRCISVSTLSGEIIADHMIPIESAEYELLGCFYQGNGMFGHKLKLSVDKAEILADGHDTATITARLCDSLGNLQKQNLTVAFEHNGKLIDSSMINGEASIFFSSQEYGKYLFHVTAKDVGDDFIEVVVR